MPEKSLSGEFELNATPPTTEETTTTSAAPSDEAQATSPAATPDAADTLEPPVERVSPHFFSSFCYYPKGVKLNDQAHDEEIILLIRRHFITNVPWIALAIVLAILGPILFPFILTFSPFPPPNTVQIALIGAFYYLMLFGFVLLKFTLWYFHVGILTNKRIKDIDIHGILYKDVAETRLNLIQDVKYDQHGFIPSLFNYGNVFVQTASAAPNIEFDRAPQPARIARIVLSMIKKYKH